MGVQGSSVVRISAMEVNAELIRSVRNLLQGRNFSHPNSNQAGAVCLFASHILIHADHQLCGSLSKTSFIRGCQDRKFFLKSGNTIF